MKIKAIIHPAEEGGYWAEVPSLPGCITEGDTWEEVTHNLQNAVEGWLSVANNSLKKNRASRRNCGKEGLDFTENYRQPLDLRESPRTKNSLYSCS